MSHLAVRPEADVSERIRLAQLASGLEPEELAAAIGISLRTYQRILDGTREVRSGEKIAIAHVTGQDPTFFGASLADDEGPSIPPPLPGEVKEGNTE